MWGWLTKRFGHLIDFPIKTMELPCKSGNDNEMDEITT